MGIEKLVAAVILCAFIISLLKQYYPTYAMLASVCATVLLMLYVLSYAEPVIAYFKSIAETSDTDYLLCLFKAMGIGALCQTAADLCEESGQKALCGKVILAGKIAVFMVTLPLFQTMLIILEELMSVA